MTLRELLDDTILRLGLCDRVDLERVRARLDLIEAQRRADEAERVLVRGAGGAEP